MILSVKSSVIGSSIERHRTLKWRQPLSEFKGSNSPATSGDTTRATARLPGLDIEIVHRRLPSA
jgi:hypothetical protein